MLIPDAEETAANEGKESNEFEFFAQKSGLEISGLAVSEACNLESPDILAAYRTTSLSLLAAYGPPPDPSVPGCEPPERPPAISDQFATAVGQGGATLRAKINSRFWTTTTYRVEYGIHPCSEGGCAQTAAVELGSKTNSAVLSDGVSLAGLSPNTTYHYRFLARTVYEVGGEVKGEAEVKGVGGTPEADGSEGTFTTAPPALPTRTDCPNQAYRTGPSAALSDCRAYELVSPLDKEGGDVVNMVNVTSFPARLMQSSASGDRMAYSTYRPFGQAVSAPTATQYLATRVAGEEWRSEAVGPPFGRSLLAPGANIDRQYKLFGPDLCEGWLRLDFKAEPVLDPDAVPGYPTLYRDRSLCGGGGGYEAISTLAPPHLGPTSYLGLELQGTSADGATAIYAAADNLPGTGAPEAVSGVRHELQLYIQTAGGTTRFLCYLPDGTPSAQRCTAGNTAAGSSGGARGNQLSGAISADGETVFFETGGALYARLNATHAATASGKCTEAEPEGACTIAIPGGATFWAASPDGSRVLYETSAGALREYFLSEGGGATLAATGSLGVMGQSTDLHRVYFASTAVLAAGAQSGKPNLYYRDLEAGTRLVAVLGSGDYGVRRVAAITAEPIFRATRVSADGAAAAFFSPAPLTGYDNADADSGEALGEVFVYEAGAEGGEGKLSCVSCDPSGARQAGRFGARGVKPWESVRSAAFIPTWESDLHPSNALSADGSRLFFNSYVPLVGRDTNGKMDVYEWEAASGEGRCEALGAERFVAAAGGCVSLISSGASNLDSELLDASPSGRDVFFSTVSSLVSQDPGLIDVYDAREGGGLPPPAEPPAPCEGEACQPRPQAPNDPTPASAGTSGPGNVTYPAARRPRCPKGKRKARRRGKVRCVRKRRHRKVHKKHKRGHRRGHAHGRRGGSR